MLPLLSVTFAKYDLAEKGNLQLSEAKLDLVFRVALVSCHRSQLWLVFPKEGKAVGSTRQA